MTRVKRGVTSTRKRKKILKYTKGFRWGRKSKERAAKEALLHAWTHAFRGRKEKKRQMKALWTVKLNAAVRAEGTTYSKFMAALKKADSKLDRKVLADLAENEPAVFKSLLETVTKK